MNRLYISQIKRILGQKILYVYLLLGIFMAVNRCMDFLSDPMNEFAQVYSGARFPLAMLQQQVVIIAPIVLTILSAVLVTGETTSGMLKLPLLHGHSRRELANAKILGLLLPALLLYVIMCTINYAICLIGWGSSISNEPLFLKWLLQVVLTILPLISLCLGVLLLSTYTRSVGLLLAIMLGILLFDSLLNQFFPGVVCNFSFLYYIYAFVDYNNVSLDFSLLMRGIPVCAISSALFYILLHRRFRQMEIS